MDAYRLHLLTLRFTDPRVEEAFRDDYARRSLGQIRLVFAVGAVLVATFAFLDPGVYSEGTRLVFGVRLTIVGVAAATIATSFTPLFLRRMQGVVGASSLAVGLAVVAICTLTFRYGRGDTDGVAVSAVALTVVPYIHVLSRLQFVVATVIGWAVVAAYILAAAPVRAPFVLVTDLFILFTAGLSGMVASYVLERSVRREFANARALSETNGELGLALDELRAAQDRLVRQEKMAALGRLSAGAAHELENPLNFVNNFSELSVDLAAELRAELESARALSVGEVLDDVGPLLDDLAANAAKVREHGRRADAVVRGMAEHAAGVTAARRPVDFNGLVEEHVGRVLGAQTERGGGVPAVERDYDPHLGTVDADAAGLGAVVESLVQNAVDAVAERAEGEERDYAPWVSVRTRLEGAVVRFEVEDNGPGVREEIRGLVFEPFFTTRPTGQGRVGLGLSRSHEVVRRHGGTLETGGTGPGATFTVTLPVTPVLGAGGRGASTHADARRGT